MNQEKATVQSLSNYLKKNLASLYDERELNAIIKIVLGYLSGKDRTFLLANPDYKLSSNNWLKINKICNQLKSMVPVQYITGKTGFFGIELNVNRDVLIPRQETEELVAHIIEEHQSDNFNILDIGTGSGCIAISLDLNIGKANLAASDKSASAVSMARYNARINNADIDFIIDDILNPDYAKYEIYDAIVSNPPYITYSEMSLMNKNVLNYEPHNALFVPDNNPLIYYSAILNMNKRILRSGGYIYFEINESKASGMKELLQKFGYENIRILEDINGKPRIAKANKR